MRSLLFVALFVAGAAACGPGRTAAATQPTPAAFDTAKSDAKAVAIADQVIAAVGGEAAWAKARQISWQQKISVDGNVKLDAHHDWDRWNGRHRYALVEGSGEEAVERYVAYDIYGKNAWAEVNGSRDIPRDRVDQMKQEAAKRLAIDAYALVMPFKLKDPGVILKYVEERADTEGGPLVSDVIKVTFDSGVGPSSGDVYYVVVDKATHLIRQIEWVEQGKPDDQRIGYKFDGWTDIAGLKLSLKRQNLGYAGEIVEFGDVKIEEPNEDLYVQQVR